MREDDALLSLFFSLPTNVVNAAERNMELKDAMRARAESDPTATAPLEVGTRVWAKWWVDLARPNAWFRATAHVKHVSEHGVTVSWVGRKGTETSFTWQNAHNTLVRAGRLERRRIGIPQVSGAELVGRRVRVYWPGDDRMYAGHVVAFHRESGAHEIEYDDGECLLEVLGSALSPEYVVM